jgi:anti-anti-sigma regulatory factor
MEIPGDCDAASASALVPILRERIAATNGPVRLDLTDAQPTAFALQLLVAAWKSLDRAGVFDGFGAHATAALSLKD